MYVVSDECLLVLNVLRKTGREALSDTVQHYALSP